MTLPERVRRAAPRCLDGGTGLLDTAALASALGQTRPTPWHGDCLGLLRALPDGCADLVVTSPPYNLRNSTGNGAKSAGGGKWNQPLRDGYDGWSDDMPHHEYVEWQRAVLTECLRVLSDDGAVFYNHKPRVQGGLWQGRDDIVGGFPVRQEIIWRRAGGMNFNPGYFLPTYEVIYLIAKPGFRLVWDAVGWGDVWDIPHDTGNAHPAPFPLALARRCVAATAATVVVDPFLGSGTTAVAAAMEGRRWVGMDVSEAYCRMAADRVTQATVGGTARQPSLLEA